MYWFKLLLMSSLCGRRSHTNRCENELHLMTNVITRNCDQDRVTIHQTKSNVVLLKDHKSVTQKNFKQELNGNSVSLSETTTHLRLFQSEVNENTINIEDRLSLARRTLYSLISTGVHGSNGLNPGCSYKYINVCSSKTFIRSRSVTIDKDSN